MSNKTKAKSGWDCGVLDAWRDRLDWHREEATAGQLTTLARRGWKVPPGRKLSRGEAFALCNAPTPGQRRTMAKHGIDPAGLSFTQAWEAINADTHSVRRRTIVS